MHFAKLALATALVAAAAHAQSTDSLDVFKKVTDSSHVSVSGNDVFRRAVQAKEAAEAGRPDVIATDPNQVEAQVVHRDSIDFLHRAPAAGATPPITPVAPAAPVPAGVPSAIASAFTSEPVEPAPRPAPAAPKSHHATVSSGHVTPAKPAPPAPPPVEHAAVVESGTAPTLQRMGAVPAPPPTPVFNDTLTTLQREAATVSQDVAPKYETEKTTIDSVRYAHNARLDSLERTESGIPDSTQRRFFHNMAEAARLKAGTPHPDSNRSQAHKP